VTVQEPKFSELQRIRARIVAVVGGVLAAVVVWSLAVLAFGNLRQPAFGDATPQHLTVLVVVVAGLIGGLVGWASISLLERLAGRMGRSWATLASWVLLISLALPFLGHGIRAGNRVWLMSMHLAVGCVLIPLLARTSTRPTVAHSSRRWLPRYRA
jgi:hypothetical protein